MSETTRDRYRTYSRSQLNAIIQRDLAVAGMGKLKELIKLGESRNSGGTGQGSHSQNIKGSPTKITQG